MLWAILWRIWKNLQQVFYAKNAFPFRLYIIQSQVSLFYYYYWIIMWLYVIYCLIFYSLWFSIYYLSWCVHISIDVVFQCFLLKRVIKKWRVTVNKINLFYLPEMTKFAMVVAHHWIFNSKLITSFSWCLL